MYTYGWFMLMFGRKQQNSVKQLSFNLKNNFKKGLRFTISTLGMFCLFFKTFKFYRVSIITSTFFSFKWVNMDILSSVCLYFYFVHCLLTSFILLLFPLFNFLLFIYFLFNFLIPVCMSFCFVYTFSFFFPMFGPSVFILTIFL